MSPQAALVWICIALFAATGIITLLALTGRIGLGHKTSSGNYPKHDYYLKRLFGALVLELIGGSLAAYVAFFGLHDQVAGLRDMVVPAAVDGAQPQDLPNSDLVEFPDEPPPLPPPPRKDTLTAEIYVSSDGPRSDVKTINIPPGWEYVGHSVQEKTRNKRASGSSDVVPPGATGRAVTAVNLRASAAGKELFGPRSWWGGVLHVKIREVQEEDS